MLLGCVFDLFHFWRLDSKAVEDVTRVQRGINGAGPVNITNSQWSAALHKRLGTTVGKSHHIHPGYPVTQHSGKATSFAPPCAASEIRSSAFCTLPCKSSQTDSDWVTATRSVGPDIVLVVR